MKEKMKAKRNISKKFKIPMLIIFGMSVIGGDATIIISGCSNAPNPNPPINPKNMPWNETKQYLNIVNKDGNNAGPLNQIDGFIDDAKQYELMKMCVTNGYNGIEFGSEIVSVGDYAFKSCKIFEWSFLFINTIVMPSVTSIEAGAFAECTNLQFVISKFLISVDDYAFFGCVNLQSITTGVLVSINSGTFIGCPNWGTISIPRGSTPWKYVPNLKDKLGPLYNWTYIFH